MLPPVTDTLLVADRFRNAALAIHDRIHGQPSPLGGECHPRNLCGREADTSISRDHDHAFWWPTDEDDDGFIDHVTVYARGGFAGHEVDALRRLTRIRQRGGRPDLLVTATYLGRGDTYKPWQPSRREGTEEIDQRECVRLGHPVLLPGPSLPRPDRRQPPPPGDPRDPRRVAAARDHRRPRRRRDDPRTRVRLRSRVALGPGRRRFRRPRAARPAPAVLPRHRSSPASYPPLAQASGQHAAAYPGACVKDPDQGHPFGLSVGLFVNRGTRFLRRISFCRYRRDHQVKGHGRMLEIRFRAPRP